MLTLKAPEALMAELETFAKERGMTRHAAALEAVAVGIAALRARGDTEVIPAGSGGDTRGDTGAARTVIPAVIPDAEALAELVAEKVAARLMSGAGAPRPLAGPQRPEAARPVAEGVSVPESLSGRARKAPGQAPRRPGDHQIGGRRKSDPPEDSVAALVLTWRKARGLSQDAAAEAFGVARKTWGRWETGERHPEAAVVERIKAEVRT